ncbi:alanine--tRNA ligase [Candidatus Bathyarchaeota archaeon]|nr:alanine--tRNA ligase [Candidatus Bathyarchaeota archaeon]
MYFTENEYRLPFFIENGYIRKRCPRCGEYFWTLNPDQTLCGESNTYGCADYTFIGNSPVNRAYTLNEMREAFLSFFEKKGHKRISPYPIVARWRDDLYFTNASIIDFQPYVTEGMIPPPANPLVISQPCVRFPDLENVGPTFGRHLTIFEMGGHHAFNYPNKEVYWKDETVRYHHEFVTKELGVKPEYVIYKEGIWSGGGNAGPDVESIVGGLEVATLVFMKYKVVNGEFVELPIRTVDTGYGIERFTWLSQGAVSCFHAVYGELLDKITSLAGIEKVEGKLLEDFARISGLISISKTVSRSENWRKIAAKLNVDVNELQRLINPVVDVFAVADHTKCLAFMLAEGVVPSNVEEGYLTRLLIRRTYRLLRNLAIEKLMPDIVDMQITYWSKDFPHLKEMRDEILELLTIEIGKYEQTLRRGKNLVKRIIRDVKAKGESEIPVGKLVELYDSHGLTPEVVSEVAASEGVAVNVPEGFYSFVAEKHVSSSKTAFKMAEEIEDLGINVSGLPETQLLYYEDAYLREFKAKVLKVSGNYIILDRTAFYPEGGGQPADRGFLEFNGTKAKVYDVKKTSGNIIVHFIEGPAPKEGEEVKGLIDWNRRMNLMRHHTATHLIMGAARRILGEHVWQTGAQKDVEQSRLDITHPKRLTREEINRIEELANEAVMRNMQVEIFWMPREEAERAYGFRLYQGGVVPGREIRVVKIGDWDVEACGGTHCKSTGEVGLIKIIRTERIQDGVERIVFSAGTPAVRRVQEIEAKVLRAADLLETPVGKVNATLRRVIGEWRELRRERERLMERIAKVMAEKYVSAAKNVNGLKFISQIVSSEEADVDLLIKVSNEIVRLNPKAIAVLICVNKNARAIVRVGGEALNAGLNAAEIARKIGAVLHGGGSGKPDFAQAGGVKIENAPKALEEAKSIIYEMLMGSE